MRVTAYQTIRRRLFRELSHARKCVTRREPYRVGMRRNKQPKVVPAKYAVAVIESLLRRVKEDMEAR